MHGLILCMIVCFAVGDTAFAQVNPPSHVRAENAPRVPTPHVHADYENRLTVLETNHRTFLVMMPVAFMVLGAILSVMWRSTQAAKHTTHVLELNHSNELTSVTTQLAALKDVVERIEKLISDTVLLGPAGR